MFLFLLSTGALATHEPPCEHAGDDWDCNGHSVDTEGDREMRWEDNTRYSSELAAASVKWDRVDSTWTRPQIDVSEDGLDNIEDVEVDDHENPSGEAANYWGWWQPTSSSDEIFLNLKNIRS